MLLTLGCLVMSSIILNTSNSRVMKRFISSLVVVSVAVVVAEICFYCLVFLLKAGLVDSHYAVRENQKYLFLGSSQIGCGVEESEIFENKVMWTCATPLQISLLQLKELERRGQLKHIKAVCINLNYMSIKTSTDPKSLTRAYYRHLPVSLRYLGDSKGEWWRLIDYCVTTAHFPYAAISPNEHPPTPRPSILTFYTKERIEDMRNNHSKWGHDWKVEKDSISAVERTILSCIKEFKVVCDRNSSRLIVMEMPMPYGFISNLTSEGRGVLSGLQNKIRGMGIDIWRSSGRYDLEDWADTYHQTESSAHKFTAELYRYLKEIDLSR